MSAMERAEKLTELTSIQEETIARADAVARIEELLGDGDLEVRLEALRALESYPEAHEVWRRVLGLAKEEPGPQRVAALRALGRVIREGDLAGAREPGYAPDLELGEPPLELFDDARLVLLDRLGDPASPEESRLALASLSYLSDEASVVAGIEALAAENDPEAQAWALRCMGLGGDGQRWGARLREAVEEGEEALFATAVQAAGRAELIDLAPVVGGGFGGKAGAEHLLEVAESEEQGPVHEAAREALASLTNPPGLGGGDDAGA